MQDFKSCNYLYKAVEFNHSGGEFSGLKVSRQGKLKLSLNNGNEVVFKGLKVLKKMSFKFRII